MLKKLLEKIYSFSVINFFGLENNNETPCENVKYIDGHTFDQTWFEGRNPVHVRSIDAAVLCDKLHDCDSGVAIHPNGDTLPLGASHIVYYKAGIFKTLYKQGAKTFHFYKVFDNANENTKYDMIFTAEFSDGTLTYHDMSTDTPPTKYNNEVAK